MEAILVVERGGPRRARPDRAAAAQKHEICGHGRPTPAAAVALHCPCRSHRPRLAGPAGNGRIVNLGRVLHNILMSSELLLELLPDPVLLVDAEQRMQQWNPAAATWAGVPAERALGRPLTELLGLESGALPNPLPVGDARGPEEVVLVPRAGQGGGPLRFRAVPVPAEAGGGLLLLAEETRAAAEREEMQRAAVRRDRLFSAMSHDLRTPITAVMGYSELLMDGIVGEVTDQQREMVERISQVSHHLAQMLTNLLDLAKLDAGRLQLTHTTVPLAATVRDVVAAAREQVEARETDVVLDLDELVSRVAYTDDTRVRQVLDILARNALRHNGRGNVAITGTVVRGTAQIAVRDAGPPLPVAGEEAIFEEFHRGPPASAEQRGTGGLELPIARRLARAMGGELSVSGTADGAIFVFTLPLQPGEGEVSATAASAAPLDTGERNI